MTLSIQQAPTLSILPAELLDAISSYLEIDESEKLRRVNSIFKQAIENSYLRKQGFPLGKHLNQLIINLLHSQIPRQFNVTSASQTVSEMILPCMKLLAQRTNNQNFADDALTVGVITESDRYEELKNFFCIKVELEYNPRFASRLACAAAHVSASALSLIPVSAISETLQNKVSEHLQTYFKSRDVVIRKIQIVYKKTQITTLKLLQTVQWSVMMAHTCFKNKFLPKNTYTQFNTGGSSSDVSELHNQGTILHLNRLSLFTHPQGASFCISHFNVEIEQLIDDISPSNRTLQSIHRDTIDAALNQALEAKKFLETALGAIKNPSVLEEVERAQNLFQNAFTSFRTAQILLLRGIDLDKTSKTTTKSVYTYLERLTQLAHLRTDELQWSSISADFESCIWYHCLELVEKAERDWQAAQHHEHLYRNYKIKNQKAVTKYDSSRHKMT